MAKILLVEDDSNLREIYGARLSAEGYDIISASDGEEALAVAVREKPDLIITDVMMPKISGFDMLDILRTTAETKDVKVIMMTALGQDEDRQRGTDLGADHYIVKSQVTLDDVVGIVNETLGQTPSATAAPTDPTTIPTDPSAVATPQDQPVVDSLIQPQQTTVPQSDASLTDEVAEFVASSPLMNGTPPQPNAEVTAPGVVQSTPVETPLEPIEPTTTPEPETDTQLPVPPTV